MTTTIKVQGQTVWFAALTDEQVDDALTHMPNGYWAQLVGGQVNS